MSKIATVIKPGAQTTVQDAGRMGARHLGVPQSGASDRVSFALTNTAVGNDWRAPALECLLGGLSLKFTAPCAFALGGADMHATLAGAPVTPYETCTAKPGDILDLKQAATGARSYIAFAGGLDSEDFLGSASTHIPAKLGGIEGRALQAGDVIARQDGSTSPTDIPADLRPVLGHDWFLRATPGPDIDDFDQKTQRRFFSTMFTTDQRADRMGVHLTGGDIKPVDLSPMKSSAVFPGTVQCPPDGAPFLLLADAQTLGGYRRMAQVIDADLHLTGQIRPGDRIWFQKVSLEDAQRITMQRASYYASILNGFSFV